MSNDKVVRPEGYYLAKTHPSLGLCIIEISHDTDNAWFPSVCVKIAGKDGLVSMDRFCWIADEPLDLEAIKLYQECDYSCNCTG